MFWVEVPSHHQIMARFINDVTAATYPETSNLEMITFYRICLQPTQPRIKCTYSISLFNLTIHLA